MNRWPYPTPLLLPGIACLDFGKVAGLETGCDTARRQAPDGPVQGPLCYFLVPPRAS